MISAEQARQLATKGLGALPSERVDLVDALDRAAAERILATRALPGFHNSAMDGYAVRFADAEGPTSLRVSQTVPAGISPDQALAPGTAARIFTGAQLPEGADTVIMQENTRRDGDTVQIDPAPSRRGQNVRYRGEDIDLGEVVVDVGQRLTPGRLTLLAAQGHRQLLVGRRPRVAIVPNGDELVPIDADLQPGQVPNTNAHMLALQVAAAGAVAWVFEPVPDRLDAVTDTLRTAARGADLVLTTGGMSVGDFDHARDALKADGELAFYKVRLKPGKPLGLGRLDGTPILGLPGNPVSAFVGFELFGRPMLLTLAGHHHVDRPRFEAVLTKAVRPNRSRPEYIRCDLVDGDLVPWPKQGSGMISSLAHADALAKIPAGSETVSAGTRVEAVDLRG